MHTALVEHIAPVSVGEVGIFHVYRRVPLDLGKNTYLLQNMLLKPCISTAFQVVCYVCQFIFMEFKGS